MLLKEYQPLILSPNQLNEAAQSSPGAPMLIRGVLLQRANAKNRNGRVYPKEILEREVSKYVQTFVNENRALGELDHCFTSDDFDVLTENGWKPFSEVQVGENVLSYNIHTKTAEYKPVIDKIENEYEGDSYTIKGRHIDTQVTPNHKFILEDRYGNIDFHTIKDIFNNRKSFNKSKIIKSGDLFTEKQSDNFILKGVPVKKNSHKNYECDIEIDSKILSGIVGIWLAEGHLTCHSGEIGQVCISQNKGEKLDEIKELLSKSPFDWYEYEGTKKISVIYIKNHQLYNFLKNLGNKYNKFIPREILNFDKECLENLIYFYNLGDGRKQKHKHGIRQNVFTVSKKLIDGLQEALVKTGGSGNLTIAHKEGTENGFINDRKIVATTDLYQLNISTVSGIYLDERFVKIDKVHHSGNIYCLSVADNHSFYVRQRNKCFFTGNSNENVINLKNVSHNIKKIWWDGDDVYGDVEILDGPEFPAGRIAAGLLRRKIPVGISSRGVGSVEQVDEGTSMVNDDFSLLTWDLVSFESTIGSNFALNEGYSVKKKRSYEALDEVIRDIICNHSGVCSCMFNKK